MLTLIEDLPQDVVGGVRLLYVLGHEVPDYTAGAAWEDAKLGLGRLRSWSASRS
jgi:hypothetical protein